MFKELAELTRRYVWPYRWQVSLGIAMFVAGNVLGWFLNWLQQYPVDLLKATMAEEAAPHIPLWVYFFLGSRLFPASVYVLLKFVALMMGIVLIQMGSRFLMRRFIRGTSQRVAYDLRDVYFTHLQKLSFSFYNRSKTGDLMERAVNDIDKVRRMVGEGVMQVTEIVTQLPGIIVLMLVLDAKLTGIVFIPFAFIPLVVYFVSQPLRRGYRRAQEKSAEISAHTQENFSGIRVVKAYTMEPQQRSILERLSRENLRINMGVVLQHSFLHAGIALLIGLSFIAAAAFGAVAVIEGRMTLGQLWAFNTYLMMLTWPVIALGMVMNMFLRGMTSMTRINAILDEEPTIKDKPPLVKLPYMKGRIEFKGLNFSYLGTDTTVLQDIDVEMKEGQKVAIVGPTGSGKTTLVSLLPRLYEVSAGQLFIDGVDVTKIPLAELRRQIGFVAQEDFLFSESLKENIAFGVGRASQDEVERAADISQLLDNVLEFPEKFDTVVGERGMTLSGGQKQRAVISRALLRDPKVLILDDAFSAVDTQTEERILQRLKKELKGRTSIIISHRISTVKDADLILVMDGGRIVERGKHRELVARGGLYSQLEKKQRLMEEIEGVG